MSDGAKLHQSFFARDALVVARALVGTRIVHGAVIARIVETEAYRGPKDLACHARAGLTRRTRTLFGAPGTAYVFFVYGMHECFNVVCKAEGAGHAVLVRAAEIVMGPKERADGPGRFARTTGLSRAFDGASLVGDGVHFLAREGPVHIGVSARIGVGYAREWADAKYRFYDASSAHVSKPPKSAIGSGVAPKIVKATTTRRSARASRR